MNAETNNITEHDIDKMLEAELEYQEIEKNPIKRASKALEKLERLFIVQRHIQENILDTLDKLGKV